MSRNPASFKEEILSEFGKVNFLRVGNFLPVSVFHHSSNKYDPSESESYWAALEELILDGAIEKTATPIEGYRLTQIGYDMATRRD